MNIDFADHPGFSAYVLLLMFSGLVMVFLASPAVRGGKASLRVLNIVLGLGYFGYGFYLAFLFQGTSYLIFFQAFIVPLVMIVRTVQSGRARRAQAAMPPTQPWGAQQQWPAQQPQQQWPAQQPQQQWAAQQQWPAQQPQQQWPAEQQSWPTPPPSYGQQPPQA